MFTLGNKGDAFGGEDGVDADLREKVLCASAEYLAKIFCGGKLWLYSTLQLNQIALDLLFGEVTGETGRIHVSSAPVEVDRPDQHIEKGHCFFHLCLEFSYFQESFFDYLLRFVGIRKEGEELIDDIGFTIFLRIHDFPVQISIDSRLIPSRGCGLQSHWRVDLGGNRRYGSCVVALGGKLGFMFEVGINLLKRMGFVGIRVKVDKIGVQTKVLVRLDKGRSGLVVNKVEMHLNFEFLINITSAQQFHQYYRNQNLLINEQWHLVQVFCTQIEMLWVCLGSCHYQL